MRAELDEARRRLADVPAAQVVANHAMGLFELAAIHLSQQPPDLGEAALAIDAMAAVVDAVGDRLGAQRGRAARRAGADPPGLRAAEAADDGLDGPASLNFRHALVTATAS